MTLNFRDPAAISDYTVTVFTGDIFTAGTNADVSITVVGENGQFDLGPFSGAGQVFNQNSEDNFDFSSEDLGDLIQVRISHNNKHGILGPFDDAGWFLDRVEVNQTDPGTGAPRRWICPCGEWLATNQADHKTARVLFPSNALTGFWRADDGGYYYLRKQLNELWWAGLSPDGLQNGLTFCNVFRGRITGQAVEGRWADVPRGITNRFGTLSLNIEMDNNGDPSRLIVTTSAGGFPATTWKHVPAPSVVRDLRNVFDRVIKNQTQPLSFDNESLHDALKPYKDTVSIIGTITRDRQLDIPNTNYPPDRARDYVSFMCPGNDHGDGDISFGFLVDRTQLDEIPDFWTDGWFHPAKNIRDKLDYHDDHQALNGMHCELIMFGRTGKCGNGGSHYDPVLLPGWGEQEGNSVLINGRPLNGKVAAGATELESNKWSVETLAGLALQVGNSELGIKSTRVRVTGPIVLDCGHGWTHDCADEDPAGPDTGPNQEIHPVYAIDVIQPKPSNNVTGTWATFDGGTCYFRQMHTQLWGLWMRPFRDRAYATVLNGSSGTDTGGRIRLEAMDIPLGDRADSNTLLLQLSPDQISLIDSDGQVVMRKMY